MFINFHSTKSEGVVIPERDTRQIDIFEYFERIEKKNILKQKPPADTVHFFQMCLPKICYLFYEIGLDLYLKGDGYS